MQTHAQTPSTQPSPQRAPARSPALVIENLSFAYPSRDSAPGFEFRMHRLTLAAGEQMLLASRSGSGKSTLLNLIAGLMDPASGSVLIDGQAVHALRGAARDRFRGSSVGMIFQTFNLLQGFNALENVLAGMMFSKIPSAQHRRRALELLQLLGIDRPFALAEELSVGQQQRVAVARALACDPVLVLADEPTASLDPENATVAIDLIQSACRAKGAALLCVSHDPSIAQRFTRVERLDALHA
jgi:putative ABC transport system ATP-binding protein